MITNYLKTAWRNLFTNKQFTLLNLIGLSTGLASAILIFLWVNDEMHVDKFSKNDDRLYKVLSNTTTATEVMTQQATPYPLGAALTKEMPEVEHAVSLNHFIDWFAGDGVAAVNDNRFKSKGLFASKDFFNVFTYQLISGKGSEVLNDKYGVVITERLAKKLFTTTENAVGKIVDWEHRMKFDQPMHVSGVVQNPPAHSTIQFDIIFNFDLLLEKDKNSASWTGSYSDTYIVLKKGTDLQKFNQKIADFGKNPKESGQGNSDLFVEQFSKLYLHGQYQNGKPVGGRITYVKLFSLIALFILVIACINFMNLSTAQSARKMKEIGVKKTMGASRRSLVFQFLAESLFMAFLALGMAMLLIALLLPQFSEITGKQLQVDFSPAFILTVAGITLFTGALSGCYPAFYLSSFNPVSVLKGKLNTSLGELWIRKGLVVFQFALSVIFIVGVIVVNKQVQYARTKNLGFDRDHIISFKREGKLKGDSEAFLSELRTLPGIASVGSVAESILSGTDSQSGYSWSGEKSDMDYLFKSPRISYGAIETLGLKVLQGRSFSSAFKDDDSKIILNESAVKKMQLKDPIGKIIKHVNSESEIIGVVNDFQYGSIHQAIEPLIFRFENSKVCTNVLVKMKPGGGQNTINQIEELYKKFHPAFLFQFSFLDADYNALYASEQKSGVLSRYFAGLAIIISCLGLFGLAAFTAHKRQKEIGVRKVVGATVSNIVFMLSKDFLRLVIISLLIAFPVAWWAMNAWLQSFASRTDISLTVFVVASVSILLITFATVSFQAIKAAIANPVKSLRTE